MKFTEKKFIFLFLKIVFPILFVLAVSGYFLQKHIEEEKKQYMYEEVTALSTLISSVYKFDQKYSMETGFYTNSDAATISQVQATFQNMSKKNDLVFEYLMAKKTDTHIEFIAYSSAKKPKNSKLSQTKYSLPVEKALDGQNGVQLQFDYNQNKVFSAYIKIADTPWALVINQPYENHIKPFKKILIYTFFILVGVLFIVYKILRYSENKNTMILQNSNERFKQLVESTNDWVWEVDASGKYTYVSHQIEAILEYKTHEVLGKTPFDFMTNDESKRAKKLFEKFTNQRERIVNLETIHLSKTGNEVIFLTNGTPFFNEEGKLLGYRGIDKDISLLKEKEKALESLAYNDILTGLPNRKHISLRIEEEIAFAKRNKIYSAIIFLDLDGFKLINDSLGHAAGDKVLKLIGTRLSNMLRKFDIVSRIGGDEFILLIRDTSKDYQTCREMIEKLVQKIIDTINVPFEINHHKNSVGASLGVAFIPADGDNLNDILKRADSAMYKAKELGKNRAFYYHDTLEKETDKIISMKNDIQQAFENNEFIMYYQPQYDSSTRKVTGYEALIRWEHPEKGLVSPFEFLTFIDRFKLNAKLDRYVFSKVQKDFNSISNLNPMIHVSINLSATSFEDNRFIEYLEKRRFDGTLKPEQITFEITEQTLIKNIDSSAISNIQKLGYRLSIDDFGTGYSSLSYISSIDFDEIKLDMSFVHKIFKSKKDASICNFILNMSKALNVDVIAEGVETEEQLIFVKEGGANIIQGNFLGKPRSFEDTKKMLEQQSTVT